MDKDEWQRGADYFVCEAILNTIKDCFASRETILFYFPKCVLQVTESTDLQEYSELLQVARNLSTSQKNHVKSFFQVPEFEMFFDEVLEDGKDVHFISGNENKFIEWILKDAPIFQVARAVRDGVLPKDFNRMDLVKWGEAAGLGLTAQGYNELCNAEQQKSDTKKTKPAKKKTVQATRGPKTKNFLRRWCVKVCLDKGMSLVQIEAAFEDYKEHCVYEGGVPKELETATKNTIKHDLSWLKEHTLEKLQGNNKAELKSFKDFLE